MGLLFVLLIGFLIYLIYSKDGFSKIRISGNKTPEDILKERFVNGEIDKETFIRMRESMNR